MNATEAMHDKLTGRLTALEAQLETQTSERTKQVTLLEQMDRTIYSLQGAIAVLRDLLTTNGTPTTAPDVETSAQLDERATS